MVTTNLIRTMLGTLSLLVCTGCRFTNQSSEVAAVPKATSVKDEESGGGDVKIGPIQLQFSAVGAISLKKRLFMDEHHRVTQHITSTYEDDTLNVVVSGVHTKNGRVNKELQSKNGPRVFNLVSKKDLKDLKKEKNYKEAASVVMFAKSVTSEGVTWNIDPPLPVYVLPTRDASRYHNLEEGLTFSGTMENGSRGFQAEVTVTTISTDDETARIEITWDLPGDQKGSLYQQLPMAKVSTYEIDTKLGVTKRFETSSLFNDDGEVQFSKFSYCLLSYKDDQDENNNKDFDGCDSSAPILPLLK